MKGEQVNLRLEEDILEDLERVASEEALDRATVIRRLLKESIKRWQLDRALRGYERGELSIGRAAEDAGLSQWELMEAMERERISYPMGASDVHERLRELGEHVPGAGNRGPGFQAQVDWLGSPVTTLADVPPKAGGILLVGINPAPVSVAAGHYYQGRLGKRLWARLARLGLLEDPVPGNEDEAFAQKGHGLTDLVKRPSASADEIAAAELESGTELLRSHIHAWEPGLILFAFKRAAAALLPNPAPGPGQEIEGVSTFLLSGPYAPSEEAARIDQMFLVILESADGSSAVAHGRKRSAPRPRSRETEEEVNVGDSKSILRLAEDRYGSPAVGLYMASTLQSEAARALGMDDKRLRDVTRSLGTYVSRGGVWDERAKLATMAELLARSPRRRTHGR